VEDDPFGVGVGVGVGVGAGRAGEGAVSTGSDIDERDLQERMIYYTLAQRKIGAGGSLIR